MRGGGGSITGDEYYRLACSCSEDAYGQVYIDNTWQVFYFADSACSGSPVAQSLNTLSGYCGSASSVSVSLLATFGAVLAVFKSL